jgi:succinate dehydrogenase/fumarate reductase-like Fe-S protein
MRGNPVTSRSEPFMGPAALAAMNNEMRNRPAAKKSLLQVAADSQGAAMCERPRVCSRVCPSKVYPARHIADLQRAIGPQILNDGSKE